MTRPKIRPTEYGGVAANGDRESSITVNPDRVTQGAHVYVSPGPGLFGASTILDSHAARAIGTALIAIADGEPVEVIIPRKDTPQ